MQTALRYSVLFTCLFVFSHNVFALSESEPNGSFATANTTIEDSTMIGAIGGSDAADYFITVPLDDGTIKMYFNFSSTVATADFFVYVYNKNGGLIGTNYLYNVGVGSFSDSLTVYCRTEDTVFFRIGSSGSFTYSFSYQTISSGVNDIEPNNTFAQANFSAYSDTIKGRLGYKSVATDNDDYFITSLPTFGTINLYIEYNNTSNSTQSDFFSYVYNKSGGLIGSSYQYNQSLGITHDTLTIFCRELDSIYFRFGSNGCFSYKMHYDIYAPTPNDPEPNNAFVDANWFNHSDTVGGRIGYTSVSVDPNDYFYTMLPDDGTIEYIVKYINTSNSTQSDFFSYIYNENGGLIGSSYKHNQPLGITFDTVRVYCRAKDTVFFRIGSNGCFSYEFNYRVIPSGSVDLEPNNSFAEASAFLDTDTVKGRIGYNSTSADANDYFYSLLPDDGTIEYIVKYINTSNSNQSDFFSYIYNKNGGLIGSSYLYNQPLGVTYDTINVFCRSQDTVFFRIGSNGCFSYEFNYRVIPTGTSDVEPNNSFAEANVINLQGTLEGKVGHVSIQADGHDYFKFYNPGYATITSLIDFNNTSGSASSDIFFYLYNSSGGQVWNSYYYDQSTGITKDTVVMSCLPQDTFYLRVSSAGCFSYQMEFEVEDQQPNAKIKYSRYGDHFAFMSEVGVNDSVYWDFDDTTSSSLFFPEKEFGIGVFDVVLKSFNKACNIFASDTTQVTVNGIEYYTPLKAGTDEFIGFFNLRIFGGGLDTSAVVELIQGGNTVTPYMKGSPDGAELNLLFNYKDFSSFGKYDLRITLSSGEVYSFPDGFEIFQDEPGFNIQTTVLGPDRVRTNRWTNYSLVVENDRARIANGVMAFIVVPRHVETNIYSLYARDTGRYVLKGAEWDKIEIDKDDFNNTYFQGNFDPLIDTTAVDFDLLYSAIDSIDPGIEIDTLYGQALEAKLYPIYIPLISGQSSTTIEFKLKSTQNSNNSFILSYVWPFTIRDNPPSGETLGYIHDGGMTLATLGGKTPFPPLKILGATAGLVDATSKAAFIKGFDLVNGQNNYEEWNYVDLPGINSTDDKTRQQINKEQHQRMKDEMQQVKILEDAAENGELDPHLKDVLLDRIKKYQEEIDKLGPNATDEQKQAAIDKLRKHLDGRNIDLTDEELDDLVNPRKTRTNKPKNPKKKKVRSVTSMDPNAIYGNFGPTANNYISSTDQLNYLVTFENVDTALAPAQIVKVNLQLDTTVFDVKRTTLGNISISGEPYYFEQDRSQYFTNIDLRPDKDIIVRVNANIDTTTGFMEWQFTSLEPSTGELLIDAFDGFLPPNVNFPEGEGSVSFITFLKESVKNEDSVGALATIYFDENDPIVTNTYTNFIDEQSPVSSLDGTINVVNDTIMELSYSGTDAGSGIRDYFLKAKVNNDEWLGIDFPIDESGKTRVTGSPGNTYSFYVFAEDSVGNAEKKTQTAEATITIEGGVESDFNPSFELYPNPNNGELNIRSNGNFANTEVNIYNIMGQQVFQTTLNFLASTDQSVDLPRLASGGYLVYFTTGSGKTNVQKLLIVRQTK